MNHKREKKGYYKELTNIVHIVFSEVSSKDGVVYIDDIDRLFKAMFPCKVEAVTLNLENEDDLKVLK